MYFLNLKELVISLSKFNPSIYSSQKPCSAGPCSLLKSVAVQYVLQWLQSHSLSFIFFSSFCVPHTGLCTYQSNTNKSVGLPADHSASSPARLKPVARANSNFTKSGGETLCDPLYLWKTHKMGLQRFDGVLSQQRLTQNVPGEGHSLAERGAHWGARQGFEEPCAQLVWLYARLVRPAALHVTWSLTRILTSSAALLFSQVLTALQESSPSPRQKF